MIPQLKIDGEVAASGDPVGLGYRQQFSMTLKGAGMNPETVSDPLTVGGIYAINLDYQTIAPGELADIARNFDQIAA